MLTRVASAATLGVQGFVVQVEVHAGRGLPAYHVVGLPDAAVRESRERITAALDACGRRLPPSRLTVNLAPAGIKKAGPAFDLPIALGLIVATCQGRRCRLDGLGVVGELSLDGRIQPLRGALALAIALRDAGIHHIIVPAANASEVAMAAGLQVHPVDHLSEVLQWLAGGGRVAALPGYADGPPAHREPRPVPSWATIRGQLHAKRALEVAAAGGHHLIMIGPPGSGKTSLARQLPGLLPCLDDEEALDVTQIASVVGQNGGQPVRQRPFRAPHHTISTAGMVGGGQPVRPGEITLAHRGVLFLDELPEFRRVTLEALRQPLETGELHLVRAQYTVRLPCQFQLVGALNPCPCGWLGDLEQRCACTPTAVRQYRARLSGPLLDRIDLHVEVARVAPELLFKSAAPGAEVAAEDVRVRLEKARARSISRFAGRSCRSNAELTATEVLGLCRLDDASVKLIHGAVRRHGLTARATTSIVKVARTIADLDGAARIARQHVAEAISYRALDRRLELD